MKINYFSIFHHETLYNAKRLGRSGDRASRSARGKRWGSFRRTAIMTRWAIIWLFCLVRIGNGNDRVLLSVANTEPSRYRSRF